MTCQPSGLGCRPTSSQDCLQGNWSLEHKEIATLYRSTEMVTATGVIDFTQATPGLTHVTLTFWNGSILVTTYTLTLHQCLGFTVSDFDQMKIEGNGSLADRSTGHFSITPRYHYV
jgi:hypothetical protein